MAEARTSLPVVRRFGETSRRDLWWIQPLLVFLVLSSFVVYATWAAFQGNHYYLDEGGRHYLSPFYSPEIFGSSPHAWFQTSLPMFVTPALLILWAPGGFRFTCYYYRGAYYKAFWADPPSCAVGEPRQHYRGENSFPLILQNVHRYFLYLALLFLIVLAWDVWNALWFIELGTGRVKFGVGLGTIVLATNLVLLGSYTFSCHSLRHLAGGCLDQLSRKPLRMKAYSCVSCMNRKHMLWAWMSLFSVAFSDLYVRMCSMGFWSDWRLL
jgi:hypothetical protein